MKKPDQQCRCCELKQPDLGTNGVCGTCWPHADAADMAKSRFHFQMWREAAGAVKRRLEGRIAALERELMDRPERVITRYLDADVLEHAQSEAERAFRSRERAWQGLVEVRLLHREADDRLCRCGTRFDRCEVAMVAHRYGNLDDWELDQVRRLRRGDRSALPDRHPARWDPRWRHPDELVIEHDEDDGDEDLPDEPTD